MNKIDWGKRFDEIQARINKKEFIEAEVAIKKAFFDAHRSFADPSFLIKELRQQKTLVDRALQK